MKYDPYQERRAMCLECGSRRPQMVTSHTTKVGGESRKDRWYRCRKCGFKFRTYEMIGQTLAGK